MWSKILMLVIVFTIGNLTNAKPEFNGTICDPLKYQCKVDDQPDMLIGQMIAVKTTHSGLCRIGSLDTRATTILHPQGYAVTTGLSYDSRTKTIYRGDVMYIEKISLDGSNKSIVYSLDFDLKGKIGSINDVALDWITQNLYICFDKAVGVINLNEKSPSKNLKLLFNITNERNFLKSIVVHPNKGYFFVSKGSVLRFDLDGSNNLVVAEINEESNHEHGILESLALDYRQDRIYWSITAAGRAVQHSKLDGSDLVKLEVSSHGNANAIAVDKSYVYYQPKLSKQLFRSNKVTGETDARFRIDNTASFVIASYFRNLVFLNEPQDVQEDHPCRDNNGGCPKFCFAVPAGNRGKLVKKCDG